jgi:photosystem II stability/assembly factor-like uncharacterized protein
MKKRITKLWGVGLVIVLLSTLFVAAAPASAANPLTWNTEVIPGTTGYVLLNPSDVTDIAIGEDGDVIYAVGGDTYVYRSTDMGVTWSQIATDAGTKVDYSVNADLVAVAADDSDVVIIADCIDGSTYDGYVMVTTDGGAEWAFLGDLVTQAGSTAINDIDISTAASGTRFVAVATADAPAAELYYIELGIGGIWKNANTLASAHAATSALACTFSPNFASDLVLTVVTIDATSTYFEVLQLTTSPAWNTTAGFDKYPVGIEDASGVFVSQAASIALAPTYLGGDEIERIAFVGIDVAADANASDGVYRLEDYAYTQVMSKKDIHSVAFDGSTCVAGITGAAGTGTTVWRSADPLTSIPTFRGTAALKSPGGDSLVVVGFAGTTIVAGTSGDESCFSVSEDVGASFNDISLIDTSIAVIEDTAVAPDGTAVYMATDNGTNFSVWRKASAWQRVLSVQADKGYIIRVAPDDTDIIYVAAYGGTDVYYSKEGGDTKWYKRGAPDNIQDIAVESSDVAYMALASKKTVSKTDNGGFVWDTPVDTDLASGVLWTIKCISEDNVIVSSTAGCVSYSTDGNESWTKIGQAVDIPVPIQVTADGLQEGNHIYAGTGAAAPLVYRWTLGQADTEPWECIYCATLPDNSYITGMTMQGGTLYASTSNGTASTFMRNTMAFMPEIAMMFWSAAPTVAADFNNAPTEMRISAAATYNKVWDCGDTTLYSFMDTLAVTAPTPIAPAAGATVPLNAQSGLPYNVTFTWSRPSMATNYTLMVALDPFFSETILRLVDCSFSFFDPVSYTLTGNNLAALTPGTTYYWAVQASQPMTSGMSAMPGLAFTLESGAAVAPTIGSPANGASNVLTTPSFSWSPVAGATMYEFQLAVGTTFTETIYSGTLPETGIRPPVELDPGVTYFWRVRSVEPVVGDWSTIANFTVAVPAEEPPPPVEIIQQPAPVIEIPAPEPAPIINIPAAPEQPAPTAQGYIWAIIIIGAILVIALVVLIVRTRRQV